ncbi:MAG: hypothetical protein GX418_00255 [Clostridiales bacterium]|nr:hypothetical protein [Clostridiales bacterium]
MAQSGLAARPVVKARTRYRLAPSEINRPVVWFTRLAGPPYLRLALAFRGVEVRDGARLVQTLRDFQEHRTRLIVAFRHPYGDEPQLLMHVFENLLPRMARQMKQPLKHRPGLRLVHDYAVALWGDAVIRFILPRVGAMPVYHIKFDAESLNRIRAVLRDGPSPLGLAPEGQISYHSETLPRIEQGTVRMGFWCARDLQKANRSEKVRILPLSVHYQYDRRDEKKVRAAVARLEALCGLPAVTSRKTPATLEDLPQRLTAVEDRLLAVTEAFYTSAYGYRPPEPTAPQTDGGARRHERWMALQPFALSIAECLLGIDPGAEDIIQRMYRVRLIGWDRVYPEEPVEKRTPLEVALAHREAGEAWYAMRHMEVVDLMSYHDPDYLDAANPAGLSFDRLVETVVNLQDLTYRLMGGNITNRPNVIRKKAVIVPGDCIELTERLPEYRADSRQTVQTVTDELAQALRNCIGVYHNGQT